MQSGCLSFWEAAFAGEKDRGQANFPVLCCTYLVRQSAVVRDEGMGNNNNTAVIIRRNYDWEKEVLYLQPLTPSTVIRKLGPS